MSSSKPIAIEQSGLRHQKIIPNANTNLADKLALRTKVLKVAQIEPLRVLETCAGKGILWAQMRQRFKVASYTPCDKKPLMPGAIRMEMTDRNLSAFDMARYNVVDIDPYGNPWEAWVNLSPRVCQKTVFFLTHGMTRAIGGHLATVLQLNNGIPLDWEIPNDNAFSLYLGLRLLFKSTAWVNIDYCLMGQTARFVRYYGLICTPKETL